MAYAEKLVKSWRACWKGPGGTILKESGFDTKKNALDYAQEQEVEARQRGQRSSPSAKLTVEEYANDWYAALDLDIATMRQYRGILENHIIPTWGDWLLRDLADADAEVTSWVQQLRDSGYSNSRVDAVRGRFSTMCVDAVAQGRLYRNPAAKQRARGKAAPRRAQRQKERDKKVVTSPLGALLIAERAAVLSGRDDEFVLLVAKYYTGLRWGELIGVEKRLLSPDGLQVDWQLSQTGGQGVARKVPKRGSVRRLDLPRFLWALLAKQAQRVGHPATDETWCPCGRELKAEYRHKPGVHLFTGRPGEYHWMHSTFVYQYFAPSAVGRFYPGLRQERPVYADVPEEGELGLFDKATSPTGTRSRPDSAIACWAPITPGMHAPHGLRHSHKTHMEELGIPAPLMDERMGHVDSSVQARYSHVTPGMRERLCEALTGAWEDSLERRAAMAPRSPVAAVDGLLASFRGGAAEGHSRSAPDGPPRQLRPSQGRMVS